MATMDPVGSVTNILGEKIDVYDANYDNSQMDQEGFLEVLLTSFKYQDPFETEDISKFIDNTVKLRELEVMQKFEESVTALNDTSALFLNSTSLIDKKVVYKGDNLYVENGEAEVEFIPQSDANEATLYIYDQNGNEVASKTFSDLKVGQKYSFSLNNPDIADGFYNVNVIATSADGSVNVDIYSSSKVTGIEKDGSTVLAIINDDKVDVKDIVKIGG